MENKIIKKHFMQYLVQPTFLTTSIFYFYYCQSFSHYMIFMNKKRIIKIENSAKSQKSLFAGQ